MKHSPTLALTLAACALSAGLATAQPSAPVYIYGRLSVCKRFKAVIERDGC